MVQGIGTSEVP